MARVHGNTRSYTTGWRTLLGDTSMTSGYDDWMLDALPTYQRVQTVPVAYPAAGGVSWNAGSTHPWTVVVDAPYPVAALSLKAFASRKTLSVSPSSTSTWSLAAAVPRDRVSNTWDDSVPLVRLKGLPATCNIAPGSIHGAFVGVTGERLIFDPPVSMFQLTLEIELLEGMRDSQFVPFYLMRPLGPAGAQGGVLNEYIYTVIITLHENAESTKDTDRST